MGGRFNNRLRAWRTAAVNAGLTGSVDRMSPWQRCVDVDRSQKTSHEHDDSVAHNCSSGSSSWRAEETKMGVCEMDARG